MTCERVKPLISALMDGEVSAAERDFILAHIRTCPTCALLYTEHRRIRTMMRELPSSEPPTTLSRDVRNRIKSVDRVSRGFGGVARLASGAVVAVAAALLVAVPLSVSSGDRIDAQLSVFLGRIAREASPTPVPVRQQVDGPLPTETPLSQPTATTVAATPTATPPQLVAAATSEPVTAIESRATPVPQASESPRPTATAPPASSTQQRVAPATQRATVAATPNPLPTRTPTRASTVAATRQPSTQATPSPVPTRSAPTPSATPAQRPPSPTIPPTKPIAPVVGGAFASVYGQNVGLRERLGLPVQAERSLDGLTQAFERGQMEWLSDGKVIYVFYRDSHNWARFADTWRADEVAIPGEPAPDGLFRPRRAFGKLWRENKLVRERLGWATAPDQAYSARQQRFERGQLVNTPTGVVVLYEDGAWQLLN